MGSGGVVTALLHSESGAGAGAYNSFDRWSTSLRGDAGPDHLRRKEMMLEAAARACMQAPVLTRITSGGPLSGHA